MDVSQEMLDEFKEIYTENTGKEPDNFWAF